SFTSSNAVDMSKEKEWASSLGGMLDWDSTRIVFTKRSLIEFLKNVGVTVDTNFSNISKLPRYATFGKLSSGDPQSSVSTSTSTTSVPGKFHTPSSPVLHVFKPTRRVREGPGGKHTDIFADEFQTEGGALSNAPPKDATESETPVSPPVPQTTKTTAEDNEESGFDFPSKPAPSRRVRTNPGGNSSIGSLWDPEPAQDEFKPTRRCRVIFDARDFF
ncbi:hypothetical protein L218DRAFT_861797, partial [Marasmius fiardii PR-910]